MLEDIETNYNSVILSKIPPKIGRYVVIDTETSGFGKYSQLLEIYAIEIIDLKITENNYYASFDIRPNSTKIYGGNKINYESERKKLLDFIKFIGNSIVFTHNALFDLRVINKELSYWNIPNLSINKFRCSMRIFKKIIGKENSLYSQRFCKLKECCDYLYIFAKVEKYHNVKFDTTMTARLICKLYQKIDENPLLYKDIILNDKQSLSDENAEILEDKKLITNEKDKDKGNHALNI